jgi:hypothetical protein
MDGRVPSTGRGVRSAASLHRIVPGLPACNSCASTLCDSRRGAVGRLEDRTLDVGVGLEDQVTALASSAKCDPARLRAAGVGKVGGTAAQSRPRREG